MPVKIRVGFGPSPARELLVHIAVFERHCALVTHPLEEGVLMSHAVCRRLDDLQSRLKERVTGVLLFANFDFLCDTALRTV